jgi:hypothetical protein
MLPHYMSAPNPASASRLRRRDDPPLAATRYIGEMKTASLPAVPVEPALRAELEAALEEGESMDAFIEAAVREHVKLRREAQAAFIARGRASLEEARRTGVYHKAEDVLKELKDKLDDARRRKAAAARR